jgi:hypothetical protein
MTHVAASTDTRGTRESKIRLFADGIQEVRPEAIDTPFAELTAIAERLTGVAPIGRGGFGSKPDLAGAQARGGRARPFIC